MGIHELETDEIMDLLGKKKHLFEDYHEATFCLKQRLKEDKTDQLQACLDDRHRIINRIERSNRSIDRATKDLNNHPGRLRKAEIIDMQRDINMLMDKSSIIEKECISLMTAEKDAVKSEILGHRMNHRRTTGYQNSGSGPARYIDTRVS